MCAKLKNGHGDCNEVPHPAYVGNGIDSLGEAWIGRLQGAHRFILAQFIVGAGKDKT